MQDGKPFAPGGALRALAYHMLWVGAEGLQNAANACLCLAAGLLRREDLHTASQLQWRRFNTTADEVDAGLDMWERRFYDALLRASDRVLLVGCGAGRDLLHLRELGYDVTGLEPVPELVELARKHLARRNVSATLQTARIESYDLDGMYDVVLLAGGCYSYVHPSAMRVSTLAKIKSHLCAGGRLVITYTGFAPRSPFAVWLTGMGARIGRADWRPERGDSFSRGYAARRLLKHEHRFHPSEVTRECAAVGLQVIRTESTGTSLYCAVVVPEADNPDGQPGDPADASR